MSEEKKIQRVRIVNEGGPGYYTTITDADTGTPIERVHRVEIAIDVLGVPKAILHLYAPLVDVIADVDVQTHCVYCKQVLPEQAQQEETKVA